MAEDRMSFRPIGVIRSEHEIESETPIQPVYARGCKGTVEVFPEFEEGLRDLEGYSHIYLIYHFHKSAGAKLLIKPFLQDVVRGVFSTRAPCRPNPIGLSVVRLLGRDGSTLSIEDVDVLNGTPLLDIKPYAARFDRIESTRDGWHAEVDEETARRRGRRDWTGGCAEGGSR